MTQKICALCDSEINHDNDTKDHVIPNSIGGRKKIKGFICRGCNSSSGDKWESAIAKQLNSLSLFFNISRERGIVPSQIVETTNGKKYQIHADGGMGLIKPSYSEEQNEKDVRIKIKARSLKEARKMLKGVQRNHPSIDIDETLKNANDEYKYCNDMFEFDLSFGGEDSGRSVVKSALSLVVDAGITATECEHAIEYLRFSNSEPCFGYYYEKRLNIKPS